MKSVAHPSLRDVAERGRSKMGIMNVAIHLSKDAPEKLAKLKDLIDWTVLVWKSEDSCPDLLKDIRKICEPFSKKEIEDYMFERDLASIREMSDRMTKILSRYSFLRLDCKVSAALESIQQAIWSSEEDREAGH